MSDPGGHRSPKWMLGFFRWFCNPDYAEDIEGDLVERFQRTAKKKGVKAAKWLFIKEILLLFRPGIVRSPAGFGEFNQYGMIKNYFKISLRNILRHKTFSALNIAGLSVGIASCLLILIYVNNERSYDTYNHQYNNTYRVLHYFGNQQEIDDFKAIANKDYMVWGNAPVAPALKDYFPEVESVFRFTSPSPWLVSYRDKTFSENNIVFADSTAFEVFDWPMIAGNPKTALNRPNTIVLTKKLAEKYFGVEDPIGQILIMDTEDPFEVTGVIDIPTNSHFSFDGMISMTTFKNRRPEIFENWGYVDFYTYFTVRSGAGMSDFADRIPDFLEKNFTASFNYDVRMEPLSEAYLYSEAGRQPGPSGSLSNIFVFTSVAIFILLIASINFMNLSTARSVERAKEVAIRKTIGSLKSALIFQFLVEAILVSFLAATVAMALVLIGHPYLEMLSGKSLPIDWLFTPRNGVLAVFLVLALGLVSGSYPAFVLSGFKPVRVLKGSFKTSSNGIWLRKTLVTLQFVLSVILLVGTSVVYSQLDFLRTHDLGFNPDRVLVIDYGYDGLVQRKIEVIKRELKQHPDVVGASASRATPGDFFPHAGTGVEEPSGEISYQSPAIYEIDEDFINTFQMNLIAGRSFSVDFPLDSSNALMLNEAAARLYGYSNPADVVGKSFEQWGRRGKVIGVVQDFNYVSLHNKVEPLSLRYGTRENISMLSLRLNSDNYTNTLSELEEIWRQNVPHRPFDTHFLDQNFNAQYEADERFGIIFTVFSGLAVFVACLGLFGLTIFSTAQRTKEVGIRKVLGASTSSIVGLLSRDFLQLFVVSLLVSVPLSWYIMTRWLENFAYSISIGWEVFAWSAICILVTSLVTMSLRTIGTALSNPVDALRDE